MKNRPPPTGIWLWLTTNVDPWDEQDLVQPLLEEELLPELELAVALLEPWPLVLEAPVLGLPDEALVTVPEEEDPVELVDAPVELEAAPELDADVPLREPVPARLADGPPPIPVGTGNSGLETPHPGNTSPTDIKAPPRRRFLRFSSACINNLNRSMVYLAREGASKHVGANAPSA